MISNEAYTKIFLKAKGLAVTEATIKEYLPVWWQNTRAKESGGLRLTEEGYDMITQELNLATYDVPFPRDFEMTTQILIFMDNFIDCPYYVTRKGVVVTQEKKAVELHLFSGDMKKYGIQKALKRQKSS